MNLTTTLCFLVAILEGLDIQAMGVAAPKLGAELHLAKDTLGRALAASNIGLVIGANIGGWLADRFGRKAVLTGATLSFGVFTLATMFAPNYEWLFAIRLGAGIGFGASLPNIMAMAVEVARPDKRGSTGSMMFCGMPVGGGTVALISWLTPNQNWRILFLIGGLAPVLLVPVLIIWMRETHRSSEGASSPGFSPGWLALIPIYMLSYFGISALAKLPSGSALMGITAWLAVLPTMVVAYTAVHRVALFSGGRTLASVLAWIILLPVLLVLFMLLNWLPTLVVAKGFAREASLAAAFFNYAAIAGAFCTGRLVDRFGMGWPLMVWFAGLIATLLLLAQAVALGPILILSGLAGFFLLGANYALYALTAMYYPKAVRGRGSGAAMAWGRIGAVVGTLLGGYLLSSGAGPGTVVNAMVPFAIIAAVATLSLSFVGTVAE